MRTWLMVLICGISMALAAQESPPDRGVAGVKSERAAGATDRRVALVIGNAAYRTGPLSNPANDAEAMAPALQKLGFEVALVRDADLGGMKRALTDFGDRIKRADVALFYYAGHGIQSGGENYLVPIGADAQSEDELSYTCLPAGMALAKMKNAGTRVNLVILDACRNNPVAREWRGVSGGLAQMKAASGTLIAFATAPGEVASDGTDSHGLYTSELLKGMGDPGVPVEIMFKRVRERVMAASGGKQVPWENLSLVGDFYFVPGGENSAPKVTAEVPITRPIKPAGTEMTLPSESGAKGRAPETSLSGIWDMSWIFPDGTTSKATLTLRGEPDTLSGTMKTQIGTGTINAVQVDGNKFSFLCMIDMGGVMVPLETKGTTTGETFEAKGKLDMEGTIVDMPMKGTKRKG